MCFPIVSIYPDIAASAIWGVGGNELTREN